MQIEETFRDPERPATEGHAIVFERAAQSLLISCWNRPDASTTSLACGRSSSRNNCSRPSIAGWPKQKSKRTNSLVDATIIEAPALPITKAERTPGCNPQTKNQSVARLGKLVSGCQVADHPDNHRESDDLNQLGNLLHGYLYLYFQERHIGQMLNIGTGDRRARPGNC